MAVRVYKNRDADELDTFCRSDAGRSFTPAKHSDEYPRKSVRKLEMANEKGCCDGGSVEKTLLIYENIAETFGLRYPRRLKKEGFPSGKPSIAIEFFVKIWYNFFTKLKGYIL